MPKKTYERLGSSGQPTFNLSEKNGACQTATGKPFGWEQDSLGWIDYDAWFFRDTKGESRRITKNPVF